MRIRLLMWMMYLCCSMVLLASCRGQVPSNHVQPNPSVADGVTSTTVRPYITPDLRWQTNWLNDIPCTLPCFMGITPGKTTVGEALDVLAQTAQIDADAFELYSSNQRQSMLITTFLTGAPGPVFEFTFSITRNQTIQTIGTNLPPFRLQQVIARFGEPTDIVVSESASAAESVPYSVTFSYEIYFVYRDQGMILPSGVMSKEKLVLEPAMLVLKPLLMEPNFDFIKQEFDQIGIPASSILPWQGWKESTFYCRSEVPGLPCQP